MTEERGGRLPGSGNAPSAPGAEPPPPAERPVAVRVGIGAFMAALILGLVSSVVTLSDVDGVVAQVQAASGADVPESTARAAFWVGAGFGAVLVVLEALVIRFAWTGRNWARVVLQVLGAVNVLGGLSGLTGPGATGSGFLGSLSVFITLISAVGLVALAVRPASEWYRAEGQRRRMRAR
ncbi:hypothetical protein ACI79J_03900 [Geodermatophilus sp. SYSU D01062]